MKLKPYPTYKDSGVEWLGMVPEGWDIKPLFSIANELKESNQGMKENNLLSLSYGKIVSKDIESNDGLLPESFETYQIIHEGDIVFRLTDLQNDKKSLRTAIVEEIGIITSAYVAIRPEGISSRYMNYLLRAYDVQKIFYSMGGGLRQSMKFSDIKRLPIIAPDLQLQNTITSFLDRERDKLDTLIAKQEKLIELLQEKRQAIISHAVTKGLNPDAKMKASGVEWLGEVPEGWTVIQFRHMASIQNGSDYKHIESDDGEYPVIGSGGEFKRATNYIYDGPSVLLGRKGTIDKPLYIEGKFWVVDTMFYTIIKDIVLPKFVFNCSKIIPFDLLSTSTALPSMTQNDLKQLVFAMPESIKEQEAIVEFIDNHTDKIDNLIEKAKRSIELAKEHRTALISAAVTGKIDVRRA